MTEWRVAELWRYPVKSLGGERVDEIAVGQGGLDGDRQWGLHHPETGTVLTARRAPELLFASARMVGPGEVVITLPDGTETADDAALSRWLERDVELVRPTHIDGGGTYENPMDIENESDWVSWQGPSWSFHDSTTSMLSIVGADTLGDRDVRRFRTNVVIEGSGEDDLVGSRVRLGTAGCTVMKHIDRCIMVTRPQPGLEKDLDVLREVIRTRNNELSVGALVDTPGRVAVGDLLRAV